MSDHPIFYGKPLIFYPAPHRYKWDGQWVPAVTTILNRLAKENLIQWAANCAVEHIKERIIGITEGELLNVLWEPLLEEARTAHRTIKKDAADVGTRVHEYARLVLQGQIPPEPLDGPAQKAIDAFWDWVARHRIEPYAVERRIMSREHFYAGTCDFYGLIDGRLSVLDFKTSKGIYDEFWWQTSGYSVAINEELHGVTGFGRPLGTDTHVRWLVHLNKVTGECEVHCRDTAEDHARDKAVWLALVELDKALRAARKHPQRKAA